jgi:hypothetical protein
LLENCVASFFNLSFSSSFVFDDKTENGNWDIFLASGDLAQICELLCVAGLPPS